MKTKTSLLLFFILSGLSAQSQRPIMELTFTAIDGAAWTQLDSIKVMNQTQGGDTVLYWPDTVLSLDYVGTPEISEESNAFRVFQNYPNPVADRTVISLYVPEQDKVSIMVTDILGRIIVRSDKVLDRGIHSFRFIPGNGSQYFFSAIWQGQCSSIKILRTGNYPGETSMLEYTGREDYTPPLKSMKDVLEFSFSPGDELLYAGYAGGLESGMLDSPEESNTYTFQFATNIPCPGTPTVEYEGQVYNTIQIFSQCWLKENLNVGEMIEGLRQTNNEIIEKWCFYDEPDSCTKYGGLYHWDEMMQYTTQQGTQGICPPGWHLPTDEEWKVLEGAVDSQYGIGNNIWEELGYRGTDAATNLKTTSGWDGNGNGTNLFGFSGLPGGYAAYGSFENLGNCSLWWTSTNYGSSGAWYRRLNYDSQEVYRLRYVKHFGFSVRCLRDQ